MILAVKVSEVKDERNGNKVTTMDCDRGYSSSYICKTNGCSAKMIFVGAYEQRRLEKIIEVPSYFKLSKGEEHIYGICPYNTKGSVEVIARDSDSNVLKSLNNGKYEFSLQVLHNPTTNNNLKTTGNLVNEKITSSSKKGKTYKKTGTASSYIKTLKQILTLRYKLEDDKELASLLTLNYRQKKVKWNDFYFEIDTYINGYNQLKSKKIEYPICIHGTISKIINPSEKFNFYKIKLSSPYIKLTEKENPLPAIELIISDSSIDLRTFNNGDEILVYGITKTSSGNWTPPDQKNEDIPKSIKFLTMTIWINHKEQILKLTS